MKVKSITVRVTRKYLEYKDLRISFCDLNRLTKLAGKKVRVGSKNKLSTRSWSGYWLSNNIYEIGCSRYQLEILKKIFPRKRVFYFKKVA